eukprot:g48309.t1
MPLSTPPTVPLSPLFSRDKCRDLGAKVSRSSTPWTSTVDIVTNLWTPVISFKEEAEKENLAALDEKKRVITRVEIIALGQETLTENLDKYAEGRERPDGPQGWGKVQGADGKTHREGGEKLAGLQRLLREWDLQHNMPPPPRCLDSSRAKFSTESGAKFTKHVYARMVMALEDEHVRASFMEACQTPSRCDLDAGNVGMNGFYQELNLLIADPEFQPEITVPTAATSDAQRIEDGESQESLAVFPTVSLLEMKLTELQPADISTIPARGLTRSRRSF